MSKKIGTFDVLKVMSSRNMDVRLSTLDNITDLELYKGNSFIRVGMSGDVVSGIAKGKFIGGFLIADKDQWNEIKAELELATPASTARTDGETKNFGKLLHRLAASLVNAHRNAHKDDGADMTEYVELYAEALRQFAAPGSVPQAPCNADALNRPR